MDYDSDSFDWTLFALGSFLVILIASFLAACAYAGYYAFSNIFTPDGQNWIYTAGYMAGCLIGVAIYAISRHSKRDLMIAIPTILLYILVTAVVSPVLFTGDLSHSDILLRAILAYLGSGVFGVIVGKYI